MSLYVDIEKDLGSFKLKVKFEQENGILGLLGQSGCGKSTTLKCIAGIVKPDKGKIISNGTVFFDSEKKINVSPQKRKVGFLFQNYALFPHMSVKENIQLGIQNLSKEEIQRLNKYKLTYKSILLGFTYFSESNPVSLDYDEALKLTKTVLPDDIKKIGSEIDNEVNKEYIYYKSSKGDFRVGLCYGYVYDDNVEKVDRNLIVGIDYARK